MIGIYKIENLINGKIYIGQSKNIKRRWITHKAIINTTSKRLQKLWDNPLYAAFRKYGTKNFSFSVIEECSPEKLNELEIYYIKKYHTYIKDPLCNGYNATPGGEGGKSLTNEEINLILKLWNNNKSIIDIHKITGFGKNTIKDYLRQFSLYDETENYLRGIRARINNTTISVAQYKVDGTLVNIFSSLNEIYEKLGYYHKYIHNNLINKTATAYGYYWIFNNKDHKTQLIEKRKIVSIYMPVVQFSLQGDYIMTYSSAREAAEKLNLNSGAIRNNCIGKSKSSGGFQWKYIKDVPYGTIKISPYKNKYISYEKITERTNNV